MIFNQNRGIIAMQVTELLRQLQFIRVIKVSEVMLLALFYYQFRSRMASKHTLRVFSLCAFLYRSEPSGSPNLIAGEPLARRFYKIKQNEGSVLIIVSANQK